MINDRHVCSSLMAQRTSRADLGQFDSVAVMLWQRVPRGNRMVPQELQRGESFAHEVDHANVP